MREAVKRFATSVASIMAQAQTQTRVAYRDEELETLQVQGVSEEYLDFATFDAERGRMITPTEIKRKRPVTLIGWGTADRLFGRRIRSTSRSGSPACRSRSSASARRRARRSASRSTSSW